MNSNQSAEMHATIQMLERELEKADINAKEATALLQRMEWVTMNGETHCLICMANGPRSGWRHTPACRLRALLTNMQRGQK